MYPIEEHDTDSTGSSDEGLVILVTGGAGFIGSHTCEQLCCRGNYVIAIDEMNSYYDVQLKKANIEQLTQKYPNLFCFRQGNINDLSFMTEIMEQWKPGTIIHLAARAGVRPSIEDPLLYIQSNIMATTVLLEMCRKYHVKKFVYASSSSVYGGSKKEAFSEDDIVDSPVSPYAASKKSCELLAATYHHLYQFDCIGLRFFTVYGPRGRPDMAPFKFMDRIARGEEIQQYGDGSSSRDYTYIEDIVDGVLRSVDYGHGNKVYNLGNGNPILLSQFIQLMEKLLGMKAKIRVLPDQPGDVPRTCADITKAKSELGYFPKTPLVEGLQKTVDWYRGYTA